MNLCRLSSSFETRHADHHWYRARVHPLRPIDQAHTMDIGDLCQGIEEVSDADDGCFATIAFSECAEDVFKYAGRGR